MSRGESKTRCRAKVNSTTPRFEPRWPPVVVTVEMMNSRISALNWVNCSYERASRSAGVSMDGRITPAAYRSTRKSHELPRRCAEPAEARRKGTTRELWVRVLAEPTNEPHWQDALELVDLASQENEFLLVAFVQRPQSQHLGFERLIGRVQGVRTTGLVAQFVAERDEVDREMLDRRGPVIAHGLDDELVRLRFAVRDDGREDVLVHVARRHADLGRKDRRRDASELRGDEAGVVQQREQTVLGEEMEMSLVEQTALGIGEQPLQQRDLDVRVRDVGN